MEDSAALRAGWLTNFPRCGSERSKRKERCPVIEQPWVVVAWDATETMAQGQVVTVEMTQKDAEYAENVGSLGLRKRCMPLSQAVGLGLE